MGVCQVDELLKVTAEDLEKQPSAGSKTIHEILQMISSIEHGEIDLDALAAEQYSDRVFADSQLSDMSRHSISELRMPAWASTILFNAGYYTMDQIAVLSRSAFIRLLEGRKSSADKIIQALDIWLSENGFCGYRERKYQEGAPLHQEYYNIAREISLALAPIIDLYPVSVLMWLSEESVLPRIDVRDTPGALEHNVLLELESPEALSLLKYYWKQTVPAGMIKASEAEAQLDMLDLPITTQQLTEFCLRHNILAEQRGIYLIQRDRAYDTILASLSAQGRNYEIAKMKLEGNTLQEIGNVYHCTRERVRQICQITIGGLPLQFEDYFAEPYEYFHIPKMEFCKIFPFISGEGYEYIAIRHRKGKTALTEETLPVYTGTWKDFLQDYLKAKTHEHELLTVSMNKIIVRVLLNNSDNPLSLEEFEEAYYAYVAERGYPADRLQLNMRSVTNRLRASKGVVFNRDNKMRYCTADPNRIWETIDFSVYRNLAISAELIFRDYPDLMEELDIRDGYELYYVMKTSLELWKGDFDIVCRRIPVIVLGEASEEEQALQLLREISPVGYWDYYAAYEERFGNRKDSVQGNPTVANAIAPYYYDGHYAIDAPSFAEEDVDVLLKILSIQKIWFIDDLERVVKIFCVHSSVEAINRAAFRQIGYNLLSSYAFSAKYGNAISFFNKEIFSGDVVDLNTLDRRITALPVFYSLLDKHKNAFDYIETTKKVLFSRHKVEKEYGLTVSSLKSLQKQLSERCTMPFFNGESIWDDVQDLPYIDRLQGNKWMLTCIIRQQAGIYSLHCTGNIILSADSKALSVSSICAWLASEHGKMSIDAYTRLFNETFGCRIAENTIAEKIGAGGMWDSLVTVTQDEYIDSLMGS